MKVNKSKILKIMVAILLAIFVYFVFIFVSIKPNQKQNWSDEAKVLPEITLSTSSVQINNIKNFSYKNTDKKYSIDYNDKNIKLNEVKNVYYLVNPFWKYDAAHTFLTFEFNNGEFISISIESRKQIGEEFSPFKGLLRGYDLLYMIVDEKDIVTLRTIVREDDLFSYKLKLTAEEKNKLFLSMLTRTNKVAKDPEFYNTLTSSCTTNLIDHLNTILTQKIKFDWRILFPEDSAKIFFDKGLIDTDDVKYDTYKDLKAVSSIKSKAIELRDLDSQEFSRKIHRVE